MRWLKFFAKFTCSAILPVILTPALIFSCAAFCVVEGDTVLVGKNLDWFVEDGIIVINQRNIIKTALLFDSAKPLQWKSTYGSVTFNQFGREFPLGGMNEAGLVVEELSYALGAYPKPDDRPTVNEFQWIQYQLDCCQSVEEVIQNATSLRVAEMLVKLHYFIADRSGQAAVVEYIDGELKIYTGNRLPVAALTNNSYENLLRYLNRHVGFGGSMTLHPGVGSQERFVRVATSLKERFWQDDGLSMHSAFHVLEAVKQNDTRWQLVYDPQKLAVYFRTRSDSTLRRIDFENLDFRCHSPSQMASINTKKVDENRILLEAYRESLNAELIRSVFTQLQHWGEIEEVPAGFVRRLSCYPESCFCGETP